jgi:hypothetical protein
MRYCLGTLMWALRQDFAKGSSLFDVDIACDQCDSVHRITRVRQVEPLRELSGAIKIRLQRRRTNQPSMPLLPASSSTSVAGRSSSNASSDSTRHSRRTSSFNRTSISDKGTVISGELNTFFVEGASKPMKGRVTNYCFSADGKSLLMWDRSEPAIAVYDVDTGNVEKHPARYVTFAAAGSKLFGIISQEKNVRPH